MAKKTISARKRTFGAGESVANKLRTGKPLTGSGSGVKSISTAQAGEILTGGIFSARGGKLQVDPASLAMALPVGKVLKAARALQAAGKAAEAAPLFARVAAKVGGRIAKKASIVGNAGRGPFSPKNLAKEERAIRRLTGRKLSAPTAPIARAASEKVFPRLPSAGNLPRGTKPTFDVLADPFLEGSWRSAVGIQPVKNRLKTGFADFSKNVAKKTEGTVNIVDTRRMNPAQAKAALEGGVSQVAKFARRVPGKEKKIGGVTGRLLRGRGK